jgi:hypothetical protein
MKKAQIIPKFRHKCEREYWESDLDIIRSLNGQRPRGIALQSTRLILFLGTRNLRNDKGWDTLYGKPRELVRQ